jgi:hypothetical protein
VIYRFAALALFFIFILIVIHVFFPRALDNPLIRLIFVTSLLITVAAFTYSVYTNIVVP